MLFCLSNYLLINFFKRKRLIHFKFLSFRYILTLITDGLRNIQSFHFDKAAGSVLASCVS